MAAKKGNNYTLKRKVNPQRTEADIDKLCEELLDFAENNRSIHFAKFCRKKGFSKQWLLETCSRHPKLAAAYDEAKELMAAKVIDLSFYDKESGVNANFGEKNLFRYDKEWKEHLKWKASLSREQKDDSQLSFSDLLKFAKSGELLKAITEAEKEKK